MSNNDTMALALARANFAVFPVGQDKKPLIRAWRENSTTNEQIIQQWWLDQPGALPAIDCGKSGLVVIDCDRHDDGADGVKAFKKLCKEHNQPLDPLFVVKTMSNGRHVYFRQPSNGHVYGNGRGKLPPGIDVRGAGGFVVGIGAETASGSRYAANKSLTEIKMVLPEWIAAILRPVETITAIASTKIDQIKPGSEREAAYAAAACDGIAAELATAAPGGRNEQLNKSAFRTRHNGRARLDQPRQGGAEPCCRGCCLRPGR